MNNKSFWFLIRIEDNRTVDKYKLSEHEVKEILEGKENKVKKLLLLKI